MSGRTSESKPLRYVGVLAALVGVAGFVVFGWRFGEVDGPVPFAIGAICFLLAVGWTLYKRAYATG